MITASHTTVAGMIAREHRRGRLEVLWIILTLAAVIVGVFSLAALWPPPAGHLPHSPTSGIQPQ